MSFSKTLLVKASSTFTAALVPKDKKLQILHYKRFYLYRCEHFEAKTKQKDILTYMYRPTEIGMTSHYHNTNHRVHNKLSKSH